LVTEESECPLDRLHDIDFKIVELRNQIIKKRQKNEKNTYEKYAMKKARHKLWQHKKLEITQNELANEFDTVKLQTEFMKEKKFNKLIDYI